MASTLTNLLYHIVFSTKERRPFIDEGFSVRLHSYIGGIARANNGLALEIGGVSDHIHILIKLRASASLSHMVQLIKSGSSKWMHDGALFGIRFAEQKNCKSQQPRIGKSADRGNPNQFSGIFPGQ